MLVKVVPHNPHDIESYMDGKDEFIKKIEKKAIQWQTLTSIDHTFGAI